MTPEPYHEVRASLALARISSGDVPSEFCSSADPNLPAHASSIERWAQENPAFAARLASAKAMGALVMLAECKKIADDPSIRVDHKRLMIDTRLKIAAIWNPAECIPTKPDKNALTGVQALLHVPFDQLEDSKKREIERFFGF
jgi:hypothetical protein